MVDVVGPEVQIAIVAKGLVLVGSALQQCGRSALAMPGVGAFPAGWVETVMAHG